MIRAPRTSKDSNGRIKLNLEQAIWFATVIFLLGAQWFKLDALSKEVAQLKIYVASSTYTRMEIDILKSQLEARINKLESKR